MEGVPSALLVLLKIIHVICGLALAAASIWFFIELQEITSLRNSNFHLLDFNIYWPQAIPWVYVFAAALVLCVTSCGFLGAQKRSRGFVATYIVFEVLAVLTLITAAVLGRVFVDCADTDEFIKKTFDEVFSNRGYPHVEKAFGALEQRLQCCGSVGPMSYHKMNEFPISCCDTSSYEWLAASAGKCEKTNQSAVDRHGCADVVISYTRVIVKLLSYGSAFTAVIGCVNIIIAIFLLNSLKKRTMIKYAGSECDTIKK